MSTTLTKATLSQIRKEIDAALAEVGKKHGFKITAGNCKFNREGTHAEFKLDMSAIASDGNVMTPDRAFLLRFAEGLGMKDVIDKSFTTGGKRHTVFGYRSNAPVKPVITKCSDGKEYVWPKDTVLALVRTSKI